MRNDWNRLEGLLLWISCIIHSFFCLYLMCSGPHALMHINHFDKQMVQQQVTITEMKEEIASLKQKSIDWQIDSFYQEKEAREQLQMARKHDEIYRI